MYARENDDNYGRPLISLMKPAFFWLEFRGPDWNVIAELGGGPRHFFSGYALG